MGEKRALLLEDSSEIPSSLCEEVDRFREMGEIGAMVARLGLAGKSPGSKANHLGCASALMIEVEFEVVATERRLSQKVVGTFAASMIECDIVTCRLLVRLFT
jgi:hypothetical protein